MTTFRSASIMKLSDLSSKIRIIIKIFVNEYTSIMQKGLAKEITSLEEKIIITLYVQIIRISFCF